MQLIGKIGLWFMLGLFVTVFAAQFLHFAYPPALKEEAPSIKPSPAVSVSQSKIYTIGHLHEDLLDSLPYDFAVLFTQVAFQESGDGLRGEVAANAKNPFGIKAEWALHNDGVYLTKNRTAFANYPTFVQSVAEIKALIDRNPLLENETVYEWLRRMHWNDYSPSYYRNVESTTFTKR